MNLLSRSERVVGIAEMGSGSAAFAVVKLFRGAPPEILAAERALLPMEERTEEATIAALGQKLAEATEKVLAAYARQAKAQPIRETTCIIRAPWTRARTARETTQFKADTTITKKLIAEVAQRGLAKITDLDRSRFLEGAVIRVELNGYATAKPEGKRASEMAATVLMSDCDPRVKAAAEQALGKTLPHVKPEFRSWTKALLLAFVDQPSWRDYVLVDVSGEASMIAVVRDAALDEQATVAEGVRTIVQRLKPAGSAEETLSNLRILGRGQSEAESAEALQRAMATIEPDLVRAFGEVFGKLAGVRRLPDHLVLLAYPDLTPWLTQFFGRIDFNQFTVTSQAFTVESFSGHFASLSTLAAGVAPDSGILIASRLVNSEFSS